MTEKLNALNFGYASAITSAIAMLLLGILANIGLYRNAALMMSQGHMFFNLSVFGILTGIIEGALIGFVFAYIFAVTYNKLLK